ncbi:MAG: hypothetical protein JXC31_03050 [Acholeplasmataceae bacterium]|nr:hypothetical protein [Acholeplasmataceae bacterium]
MNSNNKNDKDPKKPTEEELLALLEELKNKKKNRNIPLSLGFLLHRNFVVHLGLSLIINYVIAAVVLGFAAGIHQPLMEINLLGFMIGIILLTLIENFVKILMFKYFLRIMILSVGILSVFVQIIVLYAIDLILAKGFGFNGIEHLFVFAFSFSILRVITSNYLRRWLYKERLTIFGGKHK